jgi:hypothetical protein
MVIGFKAVAIAPHRASVRLHRYGTAALVIGDLSLISWTGSAAPRYQASRHTHHHASRRNVADHQAIGGHSRIITQGHAASDYGPGKDPHAIAEGWNERLEIRVVKGGRAVAQGDALVKITVPSGPDTTNHDISAVRDIKAGADVCMSDDVDPGKRDNDALEDVWQYSKQP